MGPYIGLTCVKKVLGVYLNASAACAFEHTEGVKLQACADRWRIRGTLIVYNLGFSILLVGTEMRTARGI